MKDTDDSLWLLAIDSSTKDSGVALLRGDRLVALAAPRTEEKQAVALFEWVESALKEAGITVKDVDVFAAVNGPGSFTGLRVGLTLIKGLAEMTGKPVVAVNALEAVCEAATAGGLLAPVLDARRGEVFSALYQKNKENLQEQKAAGLSTWPEFLETLEDGKISPGELSFITPSRECLPEGLQGTPFEKSRQEIISPVLAEPAARCARRKFLAGEATDALHLEAAYLRRPDAEVLWKGK